MLMKPLIPTLICGFVVALFALPWLAEGQAPPANDATKALHELFDSEWDYSMEQNPTWASTLGDRRWNDRWEDASLAAIQGRHEHDLEVIVRHATFARLAEWFDAGVNKPPPRPVTQATP